MIHLSLRDQVRTALIGPRSRPLRTTLSALGVAIGIAALTAITGIAASNQAQLLAELDMMGANLIVVQPGADSNGELVPLPETAASMIARVDEVQEVGTLHSVPDGISAYRNDLIPAGQGNGLTVLAANPAFLSAIEGSMADGEWFTDASRGLPIAILGSSSAARLGISETGVRVWVGGQWYVVGGILDSAGLAREIDDGVFLGDEWAAAHVSAVDDETVAAIYVRVAPGHVDQVREVIAAAANPTSPYVFVAPLSDLAGARETTNDALSGLAIGLAAIALFVGGVGIANTMVVAVLERRGEVGLRRALGARPGQIASQFVGEAILLGGLGGVAGVLVGAAAVFAYAVWRGQVAVVPLEVLIGGPVIALLVGIVAGLYPALSAARVAPSTALRSI